MSVPNAPHPLDREIKVGNYTLYKPVLTQENIDTQKTPEFMLYLDKITESNVEQYKTFCELFSWVESYSRKGVLHGAASGSQSAANEHKLVPFLIRQDVFSPKIRDAVLKGEVIKEVKVIHILNPNGKVNEITQEIIYTNCIIQEVVQDMGWLALIISFEAVKEKTISYQQGVETKKGNMAAGWNYKTAKAEAAK